MRVLGSVLGVAPESVPCSVMGLAPSSPMGRGPGALEVSQGLTGVGWGCTHWGWGGPGPRLRLAGRWKDRTGERAPRCSVCGALVQR